jgi:3-oxoacyl-[acyl-carrier protein] reductase
MKLNFRKNINAIVTGAGRGIGKSIAKKMARQGIFIVCVSRNKENCIKTVKEIRSDGGKSIGYNFDISKASNVEKNLQRIIKKIGSIDIIINNAGITKDNLIMRMSNQEWEDVIQTNLSGCFYLIRNCIRPMIRNRWGRIINISSVVGILGNPGQVNYASSKSGLIGLTKTLARELSSRFITVNAVAPGFIRTDMTKKLSDKIKEKIRLSIPLSRMGTPEEVTNLIIFLCSEEASYITGQTISIDGGLAM